MLGDVSVNISSGIGDWLKNNELSLVISSHQADQVLTISGMNRELRAVEYPRPMSLYMDSDTVLVSTLAELVAFDIIENSYVKDRTVYAPRVSYFCGELDVHEITKFENRFIFVNTLFSCLSCNSTHKSFATYWKPSFISELLPEDRCHLNGMASDVVTGEPRFVSAIARTDSKLGWKDYLKEGGIVMDVQSNQVVVDGLSMPHSPRIHNGKLWLLESGSGYLGYVDEKNNQFIRQILCPGFARGLTFFGNYALVTTSLPRTGNYYSGIPLNDNLLFDHLTPICGVVLIDIVQRKIIGVIEFKEKIKELYDLKIFEESLAPVILDKYDKTARQLFTYS